MIVARIRDLRFAHWHATRPALDGVSLDVRAGEILLIEGPSGSGKSTLLRAIAGLVPHFHGGRFAGSVEVLGADTRASGPAELARAVGMVFQDPETQGVRTTVANDVAFGPENLGTPPAEIPERVATALAAARATHLGDRSIPELSGGERQRAALAAVLASGPRILLLDEPTSQLDAAAVAALDAVIRDLAACGVAVVIAEHHAHRLATVPDRRVHLVGGSIATAPGEIGSPPPRLAVAGPPVLAADGLTARHPERPVLRRCSLALAAGTVTALHGDNGSGKSTLLRALIGLHPLEAGSVRLDGVEITSHPVESRVASIGYVPQDAGRRLVRERVRAELVDAVAGVGRLEVERRLRIVTDELDLVDLLERHPQDLSVGERERVAVAAVLMAAPRVLMLDEPARGMDADHRRGLAAAMRRRSADGAAVLVATHDPAFAHAAADVHLTMREGLVVHVQPAVVS